MSFLQAWWLKLRGVLALSRAEVDRGLNLYVALNVFFYAYRARLWLMLHATDTPPLFVVVGNHPLGYYLGYSRRDLQFAAVIILPLTYGFAYLSRRGRVRAERSLLVATGILFTVMAVITIAYLHVLFAMNAGLGYDLIVEVMSSVSVGELAGYSDPLDFAMAAIPVVAWLGLSRVRGVGLRVRNWGLAVAVVLTYAGYLTTTRFLTFPEPVRRTPVQGLIINTLISVFKSPKQAKDEAPVSTAQQESLRLIDDDFIDSAVPLAPEVPLPKAPFPKNVLVVVMESVGAEYVFSTSDRHPEPMPYLHELSQQGWFFANHRSTGNTSPRALFSIFSGLYSEQEVPITCGLPDVVIPSLASYLPGYDRFLVTPGRLRSYFPRAFMTHSGMELVGFESPELADAVEMTGTGRNEIQTVDYFLQRLARVGDKPFFATYYSFVPHYYYTDYGDVSRIIAHPKNSLERYLNNLRLLDDQLRRIMKALDDSGHRDDTVVVIVGDHGEAFGQHVGNRTHSKASYEENFRAPLVMLNPRVFAPRQIDERTSHVDILPTLLDAMGVSYDASHLQGESLWRPNFSRRYLFSMGNENTYTSVGERDGIKVQVSYASDTCWAYDLVHDPLERDRLGCAPFDAQRRALLKFRRYQNAVLRHYNESLLAKTPTAPVLVNAPPVH